MSSDGFELINVDDRAGAGTPTERGDSATPDDRAGAGAPTERGDSANPDDRAGAGTPTDRGDGAISDDDAGGPELVSPDRACHLLPTIGEATLTKIAERLTGLELDTEDGGRRMSLKDIATCSVSMGDDGGYYITKNKQRVLFAVVITGRSTWAFNNSPDGSVVLQDYRKYDGLPEGVTLEPIPGYASYKKTSVYADKIWTTQVFESAFKHWSPRGGEWAISGSPFGPADNIARSAFHEFNELFLKQKDTMKGVRLHDKPSNGPASSMWFIAKRPVFVPNNVTQDEGYASEYVDVFHTWRSLGPEVDVKYNRVPEVLVRRVDGVDDGWARVSFHDIHDIDKGCAMQLVVTPRAFVTREKTIVWDFRLISVRVIAKS
ncbi:hypothetical protein BD626DRAFT_540238 [Schizophyllum amplum]|uniref:Uncharacterized protein n=1 Tax=Schizophyllum amplum TaxID=97359 RepID=A0A550BZK9_9AGAR|nr:hypothetical protein BD626DRAFT_540238 [Auriculariopsis ampla]